MLTWKRVLAHLGFFFMGPTKNVAQIPSNHSTNMIFHHWCTHGTCSYRTLYRKWHVDWLPWPHNTSKQSFVFFNTLIWLPRHFRLPNTGVLPEQDYLWNRLADFIEIWYQHSLSEHLQAFFSKFWILPPGANGGQNGGKIDVFGKESPISQKLFSNFFLFCAYSFLRTSTTIPQNLVPIESL